MQEPINPLLAKYMTLIISAVLKNGAMDFDDLLFKMYELLKNHPDALSKYQRKFKYIMIDEYQDTNTHSTRSSSCWVQCMKIYVW
jgi:DNA helicase-2/ATP-dependent DNA helicase PcrA